MGVGWWVGALVLGLVEVGCWVEGGCWVLGSTEGSRGGKGCGRCGVGMGVQRSVGGVDLWCWGGRTVVGIGMGWVWAGERVGVWFVVLEKGGMIV